MNSQLSRTRAFHGFVAAVITFSLVVQLALVWVTPLSPDGHYFALGLRVWNFFSYFTIWSNVVVLITLLQLVRDPLTSTVLHRTLRLSGLAMITVTGIVYVSLLARLWNPQGWQAVADYGLHYVSPVITLLGWFVFDRTRTRGSFDSAVIGRSLVVPLVWVVYTYARAPFVHFEDAGVLRRFYPYPFMNVDELGVVGVSMALAVVFAFYLALTAAFVWLSRKPSNDQRPSQ